MTSSAPAHAHTHTRQALSRHPTPFHCGCIASSPECESHAHMCVGVCVYSCRAARQLRERRGSQEREEGEDDGVGWGEHRPSCEVRQTRTPACTHAERETTNGMQ